MAGISSKALAFGGAENKYKFNKGTELNNDLGIDWYETTYRNYDPQIGRFHQIDPFADISDGWSPYVFASNNPILRIDPTGLKDSVVNGEHVETQPPLQGVVVKSNYSNKKTFTEWGYFVDQYKNKFTEEQLYKYLENRGVNDNGLRLFHLAWETIGMRERKAALDKAQWELEEKIAKITIVIISGRIFWKLGATYLPLASSFLKDAGIQVYGLLNYLLQTGNRVLFETLAKYWPVLGIKSFEQVAKWLNEASKYRDLGEAKKTLEMLYKIFKDMDKLQF